MEQIYYTQCPVGYGLGASNGFQVKRITRGYPLASDFRHLGLRAFPAGRRTLAPPTLRYRRAGDAAEIAWLTPRPMEYETERGPWGRPGGHFAHGLILSPEEQAELDQVRRKVDDPEFIRIWWQERLRVARRVFNDPDQVEQIVELLEAARGPGEA